MSDNASTGIVEIPDKDVVAVPKDFFIDGLTLASNAYLKIKPNHYILIGKKGDVSAISNFHAVNKANAQIYVKISEYSNVTSSNFAMTEKLLKSSQIPVPTKMKYVNALADSVVNDLFRFGVGTNNIEHLRRMGTFIQEATATNEAIADILNSFENMPNNMSKHAMSTAIYSMLIAQEMNITVKAALEKLTLGALLHDVGLREIPGDLLKKPRRSWTEAEVQLYETHPLRGVEILKEIPQISNDVLLIVMEHHENSVGTGYPKRMRDLKLNPLAKIVSLADCVTDTMYGTLPATVESKTLDEVVTYIEDVLGQPFNKQVFSAFKNLANKQYLLNKKNQTST